MKQPVQKSTKLWKTEVALLLSEGSFNQKKISTLIKFVFVYPVAGWHTVQHHWHSDISNKKILKENFLDSGNTLKANGKIIPFSNEFQKQFEII